MARPIRRIGQTNGAAHANEWVKPAHRSDARLHGYASATAGQRPTTGAIGSATTYRRGNDQHAAAAEPLERPPPAACAELPFATTAWSADENPMVAILARRNTAMIVTSDLTDRMTASTTIQSIKPPG